MWNSRLFVLWAGVISVCVSQANAKNCGSNPSTIVLKRGEKITIEYWNPGPELDEAVQEHEEPLNDEPIEEPQPIDRPPLESEPVVQAQDEEATTVRDVTEATEVNNPTNTEPAADEPGVALTVQRASEFQDGSGFPPADDIAPGLERLGLEASGDGLDTTTEHRQEPKRVVVLTNFDESTIDDDTIQFAIESEHLHPVKALKQKEAAVLRATTEAVPALDTTPVPVESKAGDEIEREEGSGASSDVLLADAPVAHEFEGSGLDLPGPHTFDETFTMTKSLPEPTLQTETETETEATTDSVVVVDDTPAEFRGDDILISRIRTIVNSLSSARPLFRRTTGLLQSVFSRRSKRDVPKDFYTSQEFQQFLRSQPLPVRRALSPNFAGRFSRNMDEQSSLVEDECDLHIKTEPGLHLLMTFHNLSAPYTVDCAGAYVEIEREGNGFEARWCGNPIGQQRGMRSHVIFARSEVRVSVFNNRQMLKEKMADEKSTRHLVEPLPPTGFTADIEVIDLHDAGQYTAFQRSQAYSSVNRRIG